jgi:hypothetical protein
MVDTRRFGSAFLKAEDVRDGPRQERIVNVYVSEKFDCLTLDFQSGDQLSLSSSNVRILNKAYGTESNDWRGHLLELSLGHYQKGDETKDTVVVRPISLPPAAAGNGSPERTQAIPKLRPPAADLDDEIPF